MHRDPNACPSTQRTDRRCITCRRQLWVRQEVLETQALPEGRAPYEVSENGSFRDRLKTSQCGGGCCPLIPGDQRRQRCKFTKTWQNSRSNNLNKIVAKIDTQSSEIKNRHAEPCNKKITSMRNAKLEPDWTSAREISAQDGATWQTQTGHHKPCHDPRNLSEVTNEEK